MKINFHISFVLLIFVYTNKANNIMKTILTIETQHDGLQNACFTNVKALYSFLVVELAMKDATIRIDDNKKDLPCTYSNIVKAIRFNQSKNRFCVANIDSTMSNYTICELGILSK